MARLPQPGGDQRSQQQFIVFENFEKLNTKDDRVGLKENQLAWLENLQPIAPNKLLTVPAASSTALITGTATIDLVFYAAINSVDYLICFTTAGAAFAVNISSGIVSTIAPDGTFSSAPDVTTWQASRILIYDSKAGYCTWDTLTFAQVGGVSPNITVLNGGNSYSSAPSVTITGGTGTGVTAQAVLANGSVVAVQLTNPGTGFLPTDNIVTTFSGGGIGTGAKALAVMAGGPVASLAWSSNATYTNVGNFPLIFSGGGGINAAGNASIGNVGGSNIVTGITLTNGGSGYTNRPTATISASAGLSNGGTTIVLTMGTQSVASFTVKAGGTGYSSGSPPTITVVGGGPGNVTPASPATATATVNASGAVSAITRTAAGSGYTIPSSPVVQIGGVQAVAAAHVWPSVPNGTTLAVFQGRVWLGGSQLLQWTGLGTNVTLAVGTVVGTGSTYTTASGVVVLKLTAGNSSNFSVGQLILVSALSQSTTNVNLSQLNGYFYVTAVGTIGAITGAIQFTGPSGLGTITITGGNVAAQSAYGLVGYDDFRSAAASGSLQITDADLVHQITALRSLNNYLFIVGDQSVKQIGNISLNATGTATNFTILTLSSDQGTLYPRSCLSFNRIFMFVNPNGVYGVFGSTVQKISDDLDGIFEDVSFSQQPQSALLDLQAVHNAVWLLSYNDPVAGTRSIMIVFDGRRWWVASQGTNLAAIASAPLLSNDENVIYGTLTGTDITQLFANENTAVAWKAQTSLTPHGNVVQGKKIIRAGFTAQASGSATLTMVLGGDNSSQTLVWPVTAQSLLVGGTNDNNNAHVNTSGVNIGMTLSGTLAGFTLINMILEFQDTSLWKGA